MLHKIPWWLPVFSMFIDILKYSRSVATVTTPLKSRCNFLTGGTFTAVIMNTSWQLATQTLFCWQQQPHNNGTKTTSCFMTYWETWQHINSVHLNIVSISTAVGTPLSFDKYCRESPSITGERPPCITAYIVKSITHRDTDLLWFWLGSGSSSGCRSLRRPTDQSTGWRHYGRLSRRWY